MYISSEHFQLGRRRNHACPGQRKFSYPRRELNSRPSEYYMFIGRSNHWTGGSRVRFLPRAWKFPLSRASMVSPPFKLKMFTGSVCVLLTSVSEIKIKLIYATTSSWQKKQNGGWKVSDGDWIYFSFYDLSWFFDDPSWSESNVILFLFFVRSELIRSDFFTCLFHYPMDTAEYLETSKFENKHKHGVYHLSTSTWSY